MDVKKLLPTETEIDFNDISLESLGAHCIFGGISEDSVLDAVTFILKANQLSISPELTLFINTLGGTCSDAFALIDVIELSKVPIRTVGLGNIMSMGVLIFSSGTKGKRVLTKNACVMAHQFSSAADGKYHELIAKSQSDEYLKQQFITHFKKHSSMTVKQVEDILFSPTDRYLSPKECKKYGLADIIIDELPDLSIPVSESKRKKRIKHR